MFHASEVYSAIFRFLPRTDVDRFMLVCMLWANIIQSHEVLFALHAMNLMCGRDVNSVVLTANAAGIVCRWENMGNHIINCKITKIQMILPANMSSDEFR